MKLDGIWSVERVSGGLPPLVGVEKRIDGAVGETRVGGLASVRFDVVDGELRYRFPLQGVVDHLEPAGEGFAGRTTVAGREVGRFRMVRADEHDLRDRLLRHLDEAVAMEGAVLRLLDSMIRTTDDPAIVEALRAHRLESERHQERLRERLAAHGAAPSPVREAGEALGALVKGVLDLGRGERAARNARDAYATEHLEIAAYELLERVARRAGDEATAEVARENRDEERAMARRLDGLWDRFAEPPRE